MPQNRASLREYAAVQRERYQRATRAEKHQLLDEIVAVTGIHRKAAIRLLRREPRPHPFVAELLDRLTRCGELTLAPAVEKLLRQASRPTLARLLAPARARYPLRGATTTRPSAWLKQQIPIRTFSEWDDARPGFCEVDLVAHCGSSTQGFYLYTLCEFLATVGNRTSTRNGKLGVPGAPAIRMELRSDRPGKLYQHASCPEAFRPRGYRFAATRRRH